MVTKRGKQASRKAAARKYGFLEVPLSRIFRQHVNQYHRLFLRWDSDGYLRCNLKNPCFH
ncbi:MAG: hypothetical protein Q8K59_04670 [Nitrosomonas sp.]|nr:hypothetical protein [Nitrosomonas sp.]MDP1950383.1 hypothetical protein [Nitrosomonas sp.]